MTALQIREHDNSLDYFKGFYTNGFVDHHVFDVTY
jgi:hypothetical protein